ncbi:hypothetical protein DYH09_34555, partial [bacterium CPR1]|nr:hypothetical protein [bacterium CPR1]
QPYDHMLAICRYLPKDAVILIDGDLPAGEWDYLHYVQGHRPDVLGVFPGLLAAPWYRNMWMRDGLGEACDQRFQEALKTAKKPAELKHTQFLLDECRARNIPVYTTSVFGETKEGHFIPEGLVFRYLSKDEIPPTPEERAEKAKEILEFLDSSQRRGNYRMDLRLQPFWLRYVIGAWVRAYRSTASDLYPKYPELAERALRKAMEMDPYSGKDRVNLALLSMDERRWEQAEQLLDEALLLEPEMPLALAAKVDLYRSQGRLEEAAAWNERLEERKRRP